MNQQLPTVSGGSLESAESSALLDASRELAAILSRDLKFCYANRAFSRLLGYSTETLAGQDLRSLLYLEDGEHLFREGEGLRASPGAVFTKRCLLRASDGTWRWFEVALRKTPNGAATDGYLFHGTDINELQRMEAERQVIADIVHALNETSNLDQLLARIHGALRDVLPAENCFVALHNPANDTFEFPFFVDEFDVAPPPLKMGRTCMDYVFRTGKTALIPQSEFDRLAKMDLVELVGSPSPAWLGVPLKTPSATIGVLVVQDYKNDQAYDQRSLEFLDSVGGHIALAIQRRRADEELRHSESILRLLFERSPLPTWLYEVETLKFLRVNQAAVEQYGYSVQEFERMTILDIRPESERGKAAAFAQGPTPKMERHGTWKHQSKFGRIFEVEIIAHDLMYAGKKVRLVVARDVSERTHLESQLRQAQKMEAVGRLAGGVAHDFNNILMVIKGHTELLLNALPPGESLTRKIEQIERSADRAATLTRQLLAFSRMQVMQPQVLNLNSVVEEMGRLLPRLIGEDVELVLRVDPALGMVRADSSQMEQVLMNLAVNSRDAMPAGGKLMIETSNEEITSAFTSTHPLMTEGQYVRLVVSDSGCGMDTETQAHIFEPFFTTKEKGKGTGLGLATVYGIVKQSGGFIWVYSEVGKGTAFKIYLPRVDEMEPVEDEPERSVEIPKGTGVILLTEDEPDVRDIAGQFLESGGYQVLVARSGGEAIEHALARKGEIDLLLTDMVMPGMTGQELAEHLHRRWPELPVVFMSGYSEHAATEMAHADPGIRLLTKPFSRSALLRAVGEMLQSAPKRR